MNSFPNMNPYHSYSEFIALIKENERLKMALELHTQQTERLKTENARLITLDKKNKEQIDYLLYLNSELEMKQRVSRPRQRSPESHSLRQRSPVIRKRSPSPPVKQSRGEIVKCLKKTPIRELKEIIIGLELGQEDVAILADGLFKTHIPRFCKRGKKCPYPGCSFMHVDLTSVICEKHLLPISNRGHRCNKCVAEKADAERLDYSLSYHTKNEQE